MELKIKKVISFCFIFILLSIVCCKSYVLADDDIPEEDLSITSPAAILMDQRTGYVLYEKNSNEVRQIASLTKILTAIIAIEKLDLEDTATASYYATHSLPEGYSTAGLKENETHTISDLLDVLLVYSANDAAIVLAEHISGSEEDFSNLMNEYAQKIGCKNSHFVNSNGKEQDDHYSTAYDMAKIMQYCMKNKTFREIASKQIASLPQTENNQARSYQTTVKPLIPSTNSNPNPYYYEYLIAGKTGFTTKAGNCLVSSASKDGLELVCVILGSGKTETGESIRFYENKDIYNYGFEHFKEVTLQNTGDIVGNVSIENQSLDAYIQSDLNILVNVESDKNTISKEINLTKTNLPVAKDEQIGQIIYVVNNIKYTMPIYSTIEITAPLLSQTSSKKANSNTTSSNEYLLNNITFICTVVGISIIILLLLIYFSNKNSMATRYSPNQISDIDLEKRQFKNKDQIKKEEQQAIFSSLDKAIKMSEDVPQKRTTQSKVIQKYQFVYPKQILYAKKEQNSALKNVNLDSNIDNDKNINFETSNNMKLNQVLTSHIDNTKKVEENQSQKQSNLKNTDFKKTDLKKIDFSKDTIESLSIDTLKLELPEDSEIQIDISKLNSNKEQNAEAINAIKKLKQIETQNVKQKREKEEQSKKKQLSKLKEKIAYENSSEQIKELQEDEESPTPRKTKKQIKQLKEQNIETNSLLIDEIKNKKTSPKQSKKASENNKKEEPKKEKVTKTKTRTKAKDTTQETKSKSSQSKTKTTKSKTQTKAKTQEKK